MPVLLDQTFPRRWLHGFERNVRPDELGYNTIENSVHLNHFESFSRFDSFAGGNSVAFHQPGPIIKQPVLLHRAVASGWETTGGLVDQASAALVTDLKNRGMLDDTLIIWGGEFGRTPMAQGDGRDHHIKGFSIWMAGAGIKGGMNYGQTDELGYNAVENPVHMNDFHATILHLFGIEHTKLTYRFQGRDFRLTKVAGKVVKEILA